MSYNTRKNANNYASPIPSSIGQRRPQPQNNFVAGGQLTPTVQPVVQMPVSQQNRNPNTPARGVQQMKPMQQQQQTPIKPMAPQTPIQKAIPPQTKQTPQEAKTLFKSESAPSADPTIADLDDSKLFGEDDATMDTSTDETSPKKPFWMRNGKGKISKQEKVRRRNQRLKKIITPKNALMVLNELVGSTNYELVEASSIVPGQKAASFHAYVTVDGIKHEGIGKSKMNAKTAAAEAALKYIVMQKIASGALNPTPKASADPDASNDGTTPAEGMDVDAKNEDDDGTKEPEDSLSWSHLASFALHKLFNSWDETGAITRTPSLTNLSLDGTPAVKTATGVLQASSGIKPEMKPSKKLPANAENMNPVMLLNQMHPEAVYDEICKTGAPPRINFTLKCTVGEMVFIGHGTTKKLARKSAAYHACRDLLSIEYPAEVFEMPPPVADTAAEGGQ